MNKILSLLLLPLFLILHLIPRNKNIFLFGSNKKTNFSDNPKYLFIEINKHKDKKRKFIYVSKNKQALIEAKKYGEAVYIYSFRSIILHLRAYYFINSHSIDDFIAVLTGGAVIIQLWHGLPLKMIGNDADFKKIKFKNLKINFYWKIFPYLNYKQHTYLCVANKIFTDYFISAFNSKPEKLLFIKQPRIQFFEKNNLISGNGNGNGNGNGKIISLFPTYRGENLLSFFEYISDESLIRLNKIANERNYTIYIKPHPIELKSLRKIKKLNLNKVFIYDEIDPYPLGAKSDLIVTDYSSIYLDLITLNKKTAFICPDINKYQKEVGLYFDYYDNRNTPGHKFSTFDEFVSNIDMCLISNFDCSYILKNQSNQSIIDLINNRLL